MIRMWRNRKKRKMMRRLLKPLKAESLTEKFIRSFENLILSGKLAIGQKLPPERELAMQLGVGRQVVHEGLLHLAVRGLITMKPRAGAVVNDYRKEGSLALLESLVNFQGDKLNRKLLMDLVDLRILVEVETARLAAINRTQHHINALHDILKVEERINKENPEKLADLNFLFHHLIALTSGNVMFPLLINSTKHLIKHPVGRFYSDPILAHEVFQLHKKLVRAIEAQDEKSAMSLMKQILEKGLLSLSTRSPRQDGTESPDNKL